ncbi:MAG: Eco57I restriction-modification methylase domain-containing protein [Pirellulaceae bacterium]|nr:Eco57I restriction-modification methylase domain-containing protein [Pirellulaceae bacterium]
MWDYLNDVPQCPWGIVCNIVSFRLYHRTKTTRTYEHFTLQDLRDKNKFREFYCLFERGGFLPALAGQKPRCDDLLERSEKRQREVGGDLYKLYHDQRTSLIHHLRQPPHNLSLDEAIHVAQKLLDRIIFIAFCEDRRLLPSGIIEYAWNVSTGLADVDNPRWRSFLGLFKKIDKGDSKQHITGYNGELFKPDVLINKLELDDSRTDFFREIAAYNFDVEVNVDILGHLFEQSISDLELLRQNPDTAPSTPAPSASEGQSKTPGRRKREGVYYTPPYITKYIVSQAIGGCLKERFAALAAERKLDLAAPPAKRTGKKWAAYHQGRYDILKALRVCDPASGSGAFLIEAFDFLEGAYEEVIGDLIALEVCGEEELDKINATILQENLFGVDLSEEAVGITKLALWIRTAELGKPLSNLSENIKWGNSVVADKAVHPQAFDWQAAFPEVFDQGGFDVVIGNPPYIRQEMLVPFKEHWESRFDEVFAGTADIYVYFFALAHEILRPGGQSMYICSSAFARAAYGEALRTFLLTHDLLTQFIDLGDTQIFSDAKDVYPAIVGVAKPNERRPRKNEFVRTVRLRRADDPKRIAQIVETFGWNVPSSRLDSSGWQFDKPDLVDLRQKLLGRGKPLEQVLVGRFFRGVVTGLNDAFVIDSVQRDELLRKDPGCVELIKPFLQGMNIRKWHIEDNDDWLIFTRRGIEIDRYPAILEYLSEFRKQLEPKPVDWPTSKEWAGRKPGSYKWYEIQDSIDYWQEFEGTKIVYPDITKSARFAMDDAGRFPGNTGFAIPGGDYFLLGLLNSPQTWFLIAGISIPFGERAGEFRYRLFSQYMGKIPIPPTSKPERKAIAALAKKCCELGAERYERQTKVQRRLAQSFGEGVGGIALGQLNNKAQEWWEASLGDLGAALKTSFKLPADPFQNPKKADQWDKYLSENRREVERLTRELAAAENEINDRVYRLFELTPDEIKLLQREVEH